MFPGRYFPSDYFAPRYWERPAEADVTTYPSRRTPATKRKKKGNAYAYPMRVTVRGFRATARGAASCVAGRCRFAITTIHPTVSGRASVHVSMGVVTIRTGSVGASGKSSVRVMRQNVGLRHPTAGALVIQDVSEELLLLLDLL